MRDHSLAVGASDPLESLDERLDAGLPPVERTGHHRERGRPPPIRSADGQPVRHLGHRARPRRGRPAIVAEYQGAVRECLVPVLRSLAHKLEHVLARVSHVAPRPEDVHQRLPADVLGFPSQKVVNRFQAKIRDAPEQ